MANKPRELEWTSRDFEAWSARPRYSRMLEVGEGRVVCLKVPLMSRHESRFEEKAVFTVDMFVGRMLASKTQIAHVIEATGDDAYYYDPGDWDEWDIPHTKVAATANGADDTLPPSSASFLDDALVACRRVWSANPQGVVAVVSVDGSNTAGAIAIAALVEVAKLSLDDASEAFAIARPPGLSSEAHRQVLARRYAPPLEPPAKRPRSAARTFAAVDPNDPASATVLCAFTSLDGDDPDDDDDELLPSKFLTGPQQGYDKNLADLAKLEARSFSVDFQAAKDPSRGRRKFDEFLAYLRARRKAAAIATTPRGTTWLIEPQALAAADSNEGDGGTPKLPRVTLRRRRPPGAPPSGLG